MRLVEAAFFLGLASAVHLVAFSGMTGRDGGNIGGAQGTSSVTVQAAPEILAALADRWTAPPEVAQTPPDAPDPAPEQPPNTVLPPRIDLPETPRRPDRPSQDTSPDVADLDTRLPAPRDRPVTDLGSLPRVPRPEGDSPQPLLPASDAPRRPAPPQWSAAPSKFSEMPQIDTNPATPRLAPRASLRPMPRAAPRQPVSAQVKQPDRPSAPEPRAAQQAQGNGPNASMVQRASPGAAPKAPGGTSAAQRTAAQAQWGGQIRQSIARAQRYPRGTTARGTVTLRITVSATGRLSEALVTASSGVQALDRAALAAARAARLPRAPKILTAASYSFNLPLIFARR